MTARTAAAIPTSNRPQSARLEARISPDLSLDRYFKTQVSQDIKRRVTACFTALDAQGHIAGYYTLASASILLTDLAEPLARKMPRYPNVPAVRMGRLAVDQNFKGQGLGAALLADALRRATTAESTQT
jgi:GNAT superfamily N-acetyltransferase